MYEICNQGNNALHYAIMCNAKEIVKKIVKIDSDRDIL